MCIFINVSMYLCIYIATNQVAVYLDWLQAVHVSNPKSTRRRRPSELRDCYAFGVPVYFRDHTQSLDDAYIDTWSETTNYHSDFYIGSTFWICSPISHIAITRPLRQLIHDNGQAKRKYDVCHLWIHTGRNFSILKGYSLMAGKLIPGCQPNDYSLRLQWFIPREMRCCQHQTIMASQDMEGYMTDKSLPNDQYIGVLSTEWTYTNTPLVRAHSLCMSEWNWGFICPEWREILSVWYMAKLLSCRSL